MRAKHCLGNRVSVRATMGNEDKAVDTKQRDSSIGPVIEALQCLAEHRSYERTEQCRIPVRTKCQLYCFAHEPGGPFSRLEENIAGEAVAESNIDSALRKMMGFDVPNKGKAWRLLKPGVCLAHQSVPFARLFTVANEANLWALDALGDAEVGLRKPSIVDKPFWTRIDRRTGIKHEYPASINGWKWDGKRRPIDARQPAEFEHSRCHNGTRVTSRDKCGPRTVTKLGDANADRIPWAANSSNRLLVHPNNIWRIDQLQPSSVRRWQLFEHRLNNLPSSD
jgi:hypothetical protein